MNFNRLQDGAYETHMPSSNPNNPPYRVIIEKSEAAGGVQIYCACPGYEYRQSCRHQKAVRAELVRLAEERKVNSSQEATT